MRSANEPQTRRKPRANGAPKQNHDLQNSLQEDAWIREVCPCCPPSYIEAPSPADLAQRELALKQQALEDLLRRGRSSPSDQWVRNTLLVLLEEALAEIRERVETLREAA